MADWPALVVAVLVFVLFLAVWNWSTAVVPGSVGSASQLVALTTAAVLAGVMYLQGRR